MTRARTADITVHVTPDPNTTPRRTAIPGTHAPPARTLRPGGGAPAAFATPGRKKRARAYGRACYGRASISEADA